MKGGKGFLLTLVSSSLNDHTSSFEEDPTVLKNLCVNWKTNICVLILEQGVERLASRVKL